VFPPATFNRSKPAALEVIRQAVRPATQ
jgi:hypothetical protein